LNRVKQGISIAVCECVEPELERLTVTLVSSGWCSIDCNQWLPMCLWL